MPASQEPNFGLYHGYSLGEDGWHTGMEANLLKLGALSHLAVLDKDLTAPPGSPAEGHRYIIPAGATGAWSGQTNKIAVYLNAAWTFYTPAAGWTAWVVDESAHYAYTGSAWIGSQATQPYDIHSTFNGIPDSGSTLARVIFPRSTTIPTDFTGSYAESEVAATASTVFSITKEGVEVGTMTWGAGQTSATFVMASPQTFTAGQRLEIVAPNTPDATLADLAVTIVCWR